MTDAAAIAHQLDAHVDGDVLLPNDSDVYDHARRVWNAMVDHRPRLIVRCHTVNDVATAVQHARDHDLAIGVRCGGHSVIGHAVPDGGLMIDLSPMSSVTVDPSDRRARIQGGALLSVLDRATQEHGLATTAGNVSHTGVGGLTLGGGMGWLARQYGLTCDNVESFEVVTATGDVVRATAEENSDLFWGLRGGGGNFGIVTEFEFRVHPVPAQTLTATLWFSLEDAFAAMRRWRDLLPDAPRQATFQAWVGNVDGRPMANLGFVWVGDNLNDGSNALIAEFAGFGSPARTEINEQSYVTLQSMDDNVEGHTFRRYWKGHYLRSLPDDAIDAFLLRGTPDGTGNTLPNASFQAYGGAISDTADDDSAFSQRDALVEFVAASRWEEPGEDDERLGVSRRYGRTMEPHASGAYVNALSDEGQSGVQQAYREHKLYRLTALKDQWDPDNAFRLNHNIPPTAR